MIPLKVCFLIRQLNEGGAQRQLMELVRGLDPARVQVSVMTFYPGGIFWNAFAALPGIRLICLDKGGRFDNLFFLMRLVRRLRRLRPDVLHGYLMGGNLFASAMRAFMPRLRVVWGVRTADAAAKTGSGLDTRLIGLERMASRLPHRIVVNSMAGMEYYAGNGFPAGRMSMIPNGVDTERFRPDAAARIALRLEMGLSPGDLVLGSVGRLTPVKDHPALLSAAARFALRHPGFRLVLAGGGPEAYALQLRRQAESLGLSGIIVWAGSRADVERLYSAFDLFVSASLVEGFPNAIAEAMACGIPVAATDAGDTSHIVGDTGAIVRPGQSEAMAEAWESMLPRLGPALSTRARDRIIGEFGVAKMVERTDSLLHSLRAGNA